MLVSDLINLSLKQAGVLGVGQTAQPEDTNDAMTLANMMIAEWQVKRWLVYALVDWYLTSTGDESYGWDNSTQRMDQVDAAFFRLKTSNAVYPIDYPMEVLKAREDYNRIAIKTLSTFPQYCFYDAQYPTGNVYFWPVPPSGAYELHISAKAQLGSFSSLTQTINLPPEYQGALFSNLAMRLRSMYQLPPDPVLNGLAKASLETLRNANSQVARLEMPADLMGQRHYNIYSDQNN